MTQRLGTTYGGWVLPKEVLLNENSIVYSGGVGEDISFDIKLSAKYNCHIFLIDPTQKAWVHYNEALAYFSDKSKKFTGNIQTDYYAQIEQERPNFHKFRYHKVGLWNEKTDLKFFRQTNDNYVSQSLIENMFGDRFDMVPVDTLRNIMTLNGHTHIDLLKVDIEGAEINVINKMLDDGIHPKYLLVEFDLFLKKKDVNQTTQRLMQRLQKEKYVVLKNENWNITFVKN